MKKILVYGMSNNFGGIQTFFLNLIESFDNTKAIFDFVLSSESPVIYADKILENNGKVYQITPWGKNPMAHKKELSSIMKTSEYDYIWVNKTAASNLSVYKVASRFTNAKIITHAHGSAFETKNEGFKRKILKKLHQFNKRKLIKYSDIFFAVSTEASKWLFDFKSDSDPVYVINNGIKSEQYAYNLKIRNSLREELLLDHKPTLIQVGRLEEVKNHSFSLKVVSQVVKSTPNTQFLIVGTGKIEAKLKKQTKELDIEDNVTFLGYKNNISDYLQAADCLLLPSLSEGLPLTVVESQAAGLKSVVSKEAVPQSADVTQLVSFLSLQDSLSEWTRRIEESIHYDRKDYSDLIKQSGFDITSTVKSIEKILNIE